jgi:hypothetical protein
MAVNGIVVYVDPNMAAIPLMNRYECVYVTVTCRVVMDGCPAIGMSTVAGVIVGFVAVHGTRAAVRYALTRVCTSALV